MRPFLDLETVRLWEPFMRRWSVSAVARSQRGFLTAYKRAGGDPDELSDAWVRKREAFIARHVAQAAARGEPWWVGDIPTRRHLALVAWAYSPTPGKVEAGP